MSSVRNARDYRARPIIQIAAAAAASMMLWSSPAARAKPPGAGPHPAAGTTPALPAPPLAPVHKSKPSAAKIGKRTKGKPTVPPTDRPLLSIAPTAPLAPAAAKPAGRTVIRNGRISRSATAKLAKATPADDVAAMTTLTPDDSLGIGATTVAQSGTTYTITGTRVGGSEGNYALYESFSQLDVAAGDTVRFAVPAATIDTIFVRVTGGRPSRINGTLAVAANELVNPGLFLIDPAGIHFGKAASLAIGTGVPTTATSSELAQTFTATTADAVTLDFGSTFTAAPSAADSTLGASFATALSFNPGNSAAIHVAGATLAARSVTLAAADVTVEDAKLSGAELVALGSAGGNFDLNNLEAMPGGMLTVSRSTLQGGTELIADHLILNGTAASPVTFADGVDITAPMIGVIGTVPSVTGSSSVTTNIVTINGAAGAAVVVQAAGGGLDFVTVGTSSNLVLDESLGAPAPALTGPVYTVGMGDGLRRGANLFYSFGHFNLSAGETAQFADGDPSIQNIFVRVTGGAAASIDGNVSLLTDAANPLYPYAASVYFINPAGITIGRHAVLSLGGGTSTIAADGSPLLGGLFLSTADAVGFADHSRFSARPGSTDATLSGAAPDTLTFTSVSPAPAAVMGHVAGDPNGGSVTIVAGPISVTGGSIEADLSGGINLVAVASPGDCKLGQTPQGYNTAVDASEIATLADIAVSNGGTLVANAFGRIGGLPVAGPINVVGRDVTIQGMGSSISTVGDYAPDSGNVVVTASGSVRLLDGGAVSTLQGENGTGGNAIRITQPRP